MITELRDLPWQRHVFEGVFAEHAKSGCCFYLPRLPGKHARNTFHKCIRTERKRTDDDVTAAVNLISSRTTGTTRCFRSSSSSRTRRAWESRRCESGFPVLHAPCMQGFSSPVKSDYSEFWKRRTFSKVSLCFPVT